MLHIELLEIRMNWKLEYDMMYTNLYKYDRTMFEHAA